MLRKRIVRGITSPNYMEKDTAEPRSEDYARDNDLYADTRTPYMLDHFERITADSDNTVSGEFKKLHGETFYAIHNADKMAPFFISVISDSDHWLFVSSTGGLTAGRVSPETSLFPYVTVDKIHESAVHTGSKTLFHVKDNGNHYAWEPFNMEHDGLYVINRHLYKNLHGNKLCFEEVNHDLQMVFRYTWETSDKYGFIRHCELENLGDSNISIDMVDGLQNILPAGTPRHSQANSSNLVDAYKWTELDEQSGMAMYTLYSAISDRAEPCESLHANVVFSLGLEDHKVLVSSEQLDNFRLGKPIRQETHKRGIRGAYLVNQTIKLSPGSAKDWRLVANIEQSQDQVVALRQLLGDLSAVADEINKSIDEGTDRLSRIIGRADGLQKTQEKEVSVHHYANVIFNVLRGGIFDDQYRVSSRDFSANIKNFNRDIYQQHRSFLDGLPDKLDFTALLLAVKEQGNLQLERLCLEYLPITFGRRHGDPSRPWNQFAIRLKDDEGEPLLSYEGNWRDIFQNWEALVLSYPEFTENVIAKFVNASTVDGYNPYRITKQGIDWEIEDPDDPWSYIGYWGDHQVIYLLKLLELSNRFHPQRLSTLLHQPVYSYANVPYRIKSFDELLLDAKNTVDFDRKLSALIEKRVEKIGADGKLLLNSDGSVYQVNLLEKLLVPLLSKLGNLVLDGGIWLNTQRPEWNDANNALVGQGLSMVTLYYLRRYVHFLQKSLNTDVEVTELSREVSTWLSETATILGKLAPLPGDKKADAQQRFQVLKELGEATSRYRIAVYQQESFSGKTEHPVSEIRTLLDNALAVIDRSIANNQRSDRLYHAYNLLNVQPDSIDIDRLYPMLEGQVAVLSSGSISVEQAEKVIDALFDSTIYRDDQETFMLYPDRKLNSFLEKNIIPSDQVESIPVLQKMLAKQDDSIIIQDIDGTYRFNSRLANAGQLNDALDACTTSYGAEIDTARHLITELYEKVFNHQAFTGRSGGMFGFEGLGCVYWHMVSKLLLAVQENFFLALEQNGHNDTVCKQLGSLYYGVRKGIGFNKTPAEYGAFPTDPYSHTPKHSGAQQPGMTGQVKEEVLTRFGELGIQVNGGKVYFKPQLLRYREFVQLEREFRYLDVKDTWQTLTIPVNGLAFTWCQVPVIYRLSDQDKPQLTLHWSDQKEQSLNTLELPEKESSEIFRRTGNIRLITVTLTKDLLFGE